MKMLGAHMLAHWHSSTEPWQLTTVFHEWQCNGLARSCLTPWPYIFKRHIHIYMYIYIYIYTLYCVYSNYSNPWYSNAWCAWSRNGLLKEGPCMWARRCKAASQLAARIAVQSFFCFLSFSSYFTLPFPPRLPKKTKMSTSLLAPWPSINTRAKTA